jgi:thiamine kinase-like enzyme
MANLERENFPSPGIHEVLLVEGRYGLRMDRVKGKSMMEDLADPAKTKDTLDALVDLQCRVQKHGNTGEWAPDIKLRFRNDLLRNDRLSDGLRKKLQTTLEGLPEGVALCHCDFHAGNVFFDGADYTIIDLLQISRGDPAADAACSYMAYSFGGHPEIAAYYLDRYCEKSGISKKNVLRWLPVYAGTMLGQVPEEFTPIIERFIEGDEIKP